MKRLREGLIRGTLILAIVVSVESRADTIELFDGTRIEVASPRFQDDQLILDDGRVIPRDEVKRILFAHGKAAEVEPVQMADSDVQELLGKAADAQERYPDVGAITLIDDGEYVLRPDGTQFERSHYAVKILKEPWKAAGQLSHAYTEGRERVKLVRARTISPEGEVYEFDPADLRESKPTEGMVYFSEYKALSGQLPEVEIGSIVEVIWEKETYNPYDKELFFPRWYFGSTEPSLSSRVVIRIPRQRTLNYRVENMPGTEVAAPQISEEGEYRVYRWEMHDIEHVVPEPAMPPVGQVTPYLYASLFEDWDYLFDYLAKFQREHVQVTPEIEAKVAEIIGDSTDPAEQLAKIYHWLQREIRYISVKGSIGSGWSGHPAALTLQNKYGDCVDKAILFTTMLEVVGIKAFPVIIATNDAPADDRTLPTLYGNHAINKVYLGERSFHLDTTATTFRYPYFRPDDHGVTTVNVLEREIGFVDVPPPEDHCLDLDLDLTVEDDGDVEAVVKLEMNGFIEAGLRQGLEQVNKLLLRMVAQQFINSLSPGAVLEEIDVSDEKDLTIPLTITMNVEFPEYPSFAGDLMIFRLPVSEMIHQFDEAALEEREFDIDYKTSMQIRQHVRLVLPEGYVPKGLPEPVALRTPHARYEAHYTGDQQTVQFEENLRRAHRIIPRADYAEHKQFLEEVARCAKTPLFLYKAKESPVG